MKKIFVPITVILMSLVLAACSLTAPTTTPAATQESLAAPEQPAAQEVSIPEIKIDAADFSYTLPDSVSAGWVRVTLTNSGAEPHHVQFLRLNDGVSLAQFEEALKQGEGPALSLTKQMGGVGAIAPGGSAQAIVNLPAGEYVVLCFIPSPSDHVAHLAKGMIASFTVPAAGGPTAEEPTATLTVHMQDFTFDLPDTLPIGRMMIEVINDGPEPHELNILRLADGKTLEDVVQFLSAPDGPPPFMPVGGMNGLDVGYIGYVEFDFQPGTYVAICNIPSPKAQGHPHSALGMLKLFTVSSSASDFPTGKFVFAGNENEGFYFNEDMTWTHFYYGMHNVKGTYSVKGDLYTEETNDSLDCQFPATYKYSFDGAHLKFELVGDDKCESRREALDLRMFTLSQ